MHDHDTIQVGISVAASTETLPDASSIPLHRISASDLPGRAGDIHTIPTPLAKTDKK